MKNEIDNIIGKLGSNKIPGHDNTIKIVKQIESEKLHPLKLICDLSLTCIGEFLNDLKTGKVVPIFKESTLKILVIIDPGNRPFSVLPTLPYFS